jgi:type 1 glutamine amidotransferase
MPHRASALLLAGWVLWGCGAGSDRSATSPQPVQHGTAFRVLMLTATRGFHHDSIGAAREVMAGLSSATGEFTLTISEDVASLTGASLAGYDVLCFALTSGELPFTDEQKSAIVGFVSSGKGFVAIHSAADTLYDWPEYGRLVGAYFREHPWTQPATVLVTDQGHPATAGLGDRFAIRDEFYTFRENPTGVQVLLRLDPASVGSTGDYPLAWSHSYGSGRAYYNALGHFDSTWRDPRFERQITGALRWAAGR